MTSECLIEYLYAENVSGHSEADQCHASSTGAICPSGHNTDSSETRFAGGAQYWWDVGSTEGRVEGGPAVTPPNLSPLGLELYVFGEEYSNDDDDLFSSSEEGE